MFDRLQNYIPEAFSCQREAQVQSAHLHLLINASQGGGIYSCRRQSKTGDVAVSLWQSDDLKGERVSLLKINMIVLQHIIFLRAGHREKCNIRVC